MGICKVEFQILWVRIALAANLAHDLVIFLYMLDVFSFSISVHHHHMLLEVVLCCNLLIALRTLVFR